MLVLNDGGGGGGGGDGDGDGDGAGDGDGDGDGDGNGDGDGDDNDANASSSLVLHLMASYGFCPVCSAAMVWNSRLIEGNVFKTVPIYVHSSDFLS